MLPSYSTPQPLQPVPNKGSLLGVSNTQPALSPTGLPWPTPLNNNDKQNSDTKLQEPPSSPLSLLVAAVMGLSIKNGLDWLFSPIGTNTAQPSSSSSASSRLTHVGQWVDGLPVLKQLNTWLSSHQPKVLDSAMWSAAFTHQTPAKLETTLLHSHLEAFTQWAQHGLYNQLGRKGLDQTTIDRGERFCQAVSQHLSPAKLTRFDELPDAIALVKTAMAEPNLTGEQVLQQLGKADGMLSMLQKRLIDGLGQHLLPIYKQEYTVLNTLALQPVSRTVASVLNTLKRVLGGDVIPKPHSPAQAFKTVTQQLTAGQNAQSLGFIGKIWSSAWAGLKKRVAPLFLGLVLFAPALDAASKADKGERHKAFFENLLGTGIGNFIGWEISSVFLNKTQWVAHALHYIKPGLALKPLFGGAMSLSGLLTQITALVVATKVFERLGSEFSKLVVGPEKKDPLGRFHQVPKKATPQPSPSKGLSSPAMAALSPTSSTSQRSPISAVTPAKITLPSVAGPPPLAPSDSLPTEIPDSFTPTPPPLEQEGSALPTPSTTKGADASLPTPTTSTTSQPVDASSAPALTPLTAGPRVSLQPASAATGPSLTPAELATLMGVS
jgi:hypothetical protein